jgi:hypothetical protein
MDSSNEVQTQTYEEYMMTKLSGYHFKNDQLLKKAFEEYLHLNKYEYNEVMKFAETHQMTKMLIDGRFEFRLTIIAYTNDENIFEKHFHNFIKTIESLATCIIYYNKNIIYYNKNIKDEIGNENGNKNGKGTEKRVVDYCLYMSRRSEVYDDDNIKTMKRLKYI